MEDSPEATWGSHLQEEIRVCPSSTPVPRNEEPWAKCLVTWRSSNNVGALTGLPSTTRLSTWMHRSFSSPERQTLPLARARQGEGSPAHQSSPHRTQVPISVSITSILSFLVCLGGSGG